VQGRGAGQRHQGVVLHLPPVMPCPRRRGPRRPAGRAGRLLPAVALATVALGASVPFARAAAPPSGLGDQSVFWIAVSPAYQHTGLLLAETTPFSSCTGNCTQLWASHDGGATWAQSPAAGWQQGRPVIVVDSAGREVAFAASSGGLQRSDDQGASWHGVGGPGALPAPDPAFARTAMVAVASGNTSGDYALHGSTSQPVNGSGGSITDLSFALSPTYPGGGGFAPALLSGADTSSSLPVIQRCTSALSCTGRTTLTGATNFSAPVTLTLAPDYAQSGAVFAQSGRGIYKSVDGGNNFAPLPIADGAGSATTATPSLALAPGYRDRGPQHTLFVSVFSVKPDPTNPRTGGGIYRSDDGGATWRTVGSPSPLDSGSTAVVVAPDGRVFAGYIGSSSAGTHGGLLCSTDGGGSWHATCPGVGDGARSAAGGGGTSGAGAGGVIEPRTANTATPCAASGCVVLASPVAGAGARSQGRSGEGAAVAGAQAGAGKPSGGGGRLGPLLGLVLVAAAATGGTIAVRRRRAT
jgi:hypothetical protein